MLLDTNALLWMHIGNSRLGKSARRLIENSDSVYFSSLSILEIEMKRLQGRIKIKENIDVDFLDDGYREIKFASSYVPHIKQFSSLVKHDPFDRALLATAAAEKLPFITSDSKLLALGFDFIIDAQI